MDIYDDFLLKTTAENIYKPTAKRAKSACRVYTVVESDTDKYIVLLFIQHRIHSQIKR